MEKLCRICRTSESIEELSEFYDDPKVPVDFYFVTGIKVVSIDPSNPAFICSTCTDSIKIFTKFKRKAQKSDEFFHLQSQKFENNFWKRQKSENFGSSPLIKQEPDMVNSIAYWADIGNITQNSVSNLDFIDESEEHFENFYEEGGNDEDLSDNDAQTGTEFVDSLTENSNFVKFAGPKSKTQNITSKNLKLESNSDPNTKIKQCKICGKQLKSNKSLELHMSVVHNTDNKVYTCSHCQQIFKHISYVKNHVRKQHNLSYLKNRDVVIKIVKNRGKSSELKNENPAESKDNIKTIDPEIFNEKLSKICKICGREFSSIRSCKDHMVIAHGAAKDVYVCKICDGRFKLKDYLARHMKKQHKTSPNNKNYLIKENESENEQYEEIDKDVVDMAKPETRVTTSYCQECNRTFCSTRSYSEHMKVKHKTDNKIYICKFCDEKFIVPSYLKRHARMLHNHTLKPHEVIVKRKPDLGVKKKVRVKRMKRVKKEEKIEASNLSEDIVNNMQD